MPRWISLAVAFVSAVLLLSGGGYVLARWWELDPLIPALASIFKISLIVVAGCAGYACLVGLYHVVLSVTGLDEERGEGKAEP